jgi:cytoskeletal protein CcmA (bactofilin family)
LRAKKSATPSSGCAAQRVATRAVTVQKGFTIKGNKVRWTDKALAHFKGHVPLTVEG